MSDWYPRVLAAASDGGDGADGIDRNADDAQKTPQKPRRRRTSKATPGNAGNWPARMVVLRQRTALWFRWTREQKLHMSPRELEAAAQADGVALSEAGVRRFEKMSDRDEATERQWVAMEYVLWLAAYSGQSFADVARFLMGGDWSQVGLLSDVAPSDESQADRLRAAFLTLTEDRKKTLLDLMTFLQSREDADRQIARGVRYLPPHPSLADRKTAEQTPGEAANVAPDAVQDAAPGAGYAIDPGTQAVLDDLARGEEELRQELIRHEEQRPDRPRHRDRPADQQPGQEDDDQRRRHRK